MSLSQTLRIYELLDDASVTGSDVVKLFTPHQDLGVTAKTETVIETRRADFLDILVPGTSGKAAGDGSAPTLGLIGRNGSAAGPPWWGWCRTRTAPPLRSRRRSGSRR